MAGMPGEPARALAPFAWPALLSAFAAGLLLWGGHPGAAAALLALAGGGAGFLLAGRIGRRSSPAEDPETAALRGRVRELEERAARLEEQKREIEGVLHSTMDPAVAKLLLERRLHNEKRALSVLFSDLTGFTATVEDSPPEAIIEPLNRLFSAMEPVIARFRGHLDKFMGDGLMAEFGAPHSLHHHALLAVLTGLAMQRRLKELNVPWRMRIGVASGVSLVGMMGSERRRSYTALGDTVNLAARLQALCPPGALCIDEKVHGEVRRWLTLRRIRSGLNPEAARRMEEQLRALRAELERAPKADDCLKAAELCAGLGDMQQALGFHKRALELEPGRRAPVERALAETLLRGEERAYLDIKGKKERVAVYVVEGLKDFLPVARVPRKVRWIYAWLESELKLPEELMLSVEALEGSLGHAQVTAALSATIAEQMGLDEAQVRAAFLAGYLCDAGKRRVPEHLLCYEGRFADLPPEDQAKLQSHASASLAVLAEEGIAPGAEVLAAIAQHHERFDGKGYPAGLRGEQIHRLARIVRIADTYEAITAWRAYQDSLTRSAALIEICRDISGGALDPEIAKVFLELMSEDAAQQEARA